MLTAQKIGTSFDLPEASAVRRTAPKRKKRGSASINAHKLMTFRTNAFLREFLPIDSARVLTARGFLRVLFNAGGRKGRRGGREEGEQQK